MPEDALPSGLLSNAPGSGSRSYVRKVAIYQGVDIFLATDGLQICVLDGMKVTDGYAGGEVCNSLDAVIEEPLAVRSGEFGLGYVVVPHACAFSPDSSLAAGAADYPGVTVMRLDRTGSLSGTLSCNRAESVHIDMGP